MKLMMEIEGGRKRVKGRGGMGRVEGEGEIEVEKMGGD